MKNQMKVKIEKEKVRLEIEQHLSELDNLLKVYSQLEAKDGSRYAVYGQLNEIQRGVEDLLMAISSIEEDIE